MKEQKYIREELSDLAPQLARRQGDGDGWHTPEGLLTGLADRVLAAPADTPARPRRLAVAWPTLALAAALALAIGLACWLWWSPAVTSASQPMAMDLRSLTDEELSAYLDAHIDEFDLALLLESGLVSSTPAVLTPADTPPADPNMQELENYLRDVIDSETEATLQPHTF